MNIAFIGLGHMGHPMVCNLIKAGHSVRVFDVVPDAIQSLVKDGAEAADSISDAIQNAEVVFTMVQSGDQVSELCFGDDGIFNNINKEALYIDSSSIDIDVSRDIHRRAGEMNLAMVDAPVSGGVKAAEAGSLTIMVGGTDENFKRAEPILKHLGQRVIHAGAPGNGQAAKICNNMILGVSMIAVSEAFNLGEKLGLDPKKLFEISSHASGQCWSMTSYCPAPDILPDVPSSHDYKPGFTAAMMLKDLNLSQSAAEHAHATTALGAKATEIYKHFVDSGNAQVDFSGVMQMIESGRE